MTGAGFVPEDAVSRRTAGGAVGVATVAGGGAIVVGTAVGACAGSVGGGVRTGLGRGRSIRRGGGVRRTTTGGVTGSLFRPGHSRTFCIARNADANSAAVAPRETTRLGQRCS